MPCEYWLIGRGSVGIEAGGAHGFFGRETGPGAVEAAEVAQIFDSGEFVIEHGRVAHVADAVALFGRGVAEDGDRAEGWAEKPGDGAQQGRFAGAVLTEEDVAAALFEADAIWRSAANVP